MRLGISCNRFGSGGGLERYALDIAGALSKMPGVRVDVFARGFDRGVAESLGVEPHRIEVSWLPGKLRDLGFSRALATRRIGCDLVIGCNRVRGTDVAICGGTHLGYLAARGRRARVFDRLQVAVESDQYAGAAVVVAHSRLMHEELRTLYGVADDRIELLYPPVDSRRFSPVGEASRKALRRKYGFGNETVLLFPSSGHARKGLDLLSAAVQRSAANLVLAVAGRPVGRPQPRVRELGYVTAIEELYRAADFTVLASDYEPFGLVGIESVLCGTPLIFADSVGCLEVLDDAAVESFSRTDPASLDAAIERAIGRADCGGGRLDEPRMLLRYDPSVATHVASLVAICRRILASRSEQ